MFGQVDVPLDRRQKTGCAYAGYPPIRQAPPRKETSVRHKKRLQDFL